MFMHIVLALMLLLGLSYAWVASDRENPQSVRQAQQELDNLRGFAFSANRFVASHHDFEGVLTWQGGEGSQSLAAAFSTPSALQQISMPQGWRVLVEQGDFVLCTTLSEPAIALASQTFPDKISGTLVAGYGQTAGSLVFATDEDRQLVLGGDETLTAAQQWVEKCNS